MAVIVAVVTELLFPILDKDGSGTLDALEVFIGLAIMCSDSREKKMYTVFNIMDADKSGKITKEELRRFIALIAPPTIADADIDNMVNGCLKDADMGSSKSITFEKVSNPGTVRHSQAQSDTVRHSQTVKQKDRGQVQGLRASGDSQVQGLRAGRESQVVTAVCFIEFVVSAAVIGCGGSS